MKPPRTEFTDVERWSTDHEESHASQVTPAKRIIPNCMLFIIKTRIGHVLTVGNFHPTKIRSRIKQKINIINIVGSIISFPYGPNVIANRRDAFSRPC